MIDSCQRRMIDRRSILVDSRLSDYAPFALENDRNLPFDPQRRTRQGVKRDWGKQNKNKNNGKTNEHFLLSGVVVGSIIGLLLVLLVVAIVFIGFRLSKYVPLLSSLSPRSTNDFSSLDIAERRICDICKPMTIITNI